MLLLFCKNSFVSTGFGFGSFYFFPLFAFSNLKNCNRKYKKKLVTCFFLSLRDWRIPVYIGMLLLRSGNYQTIFSLWNMGTWSIRSVSFRLICFHLFFIHGIPFSVVFSLFLNNSISFFLSLFCFPSMSIVVSFLVSVNEPQIDAQVIVSMIANKHWNQTVLGKWNRKGSKRRKKNHLV